MTDTPPILTPKVTLLSWTNLPLETVYSTWMQSKNNGPLMTPQEVKEKIDPAEVRKLFMAVIEQRIPIGEHIDFVYVFENISVSWREQAVRHRIGTLASPERVGSDYTFDVMPNLADSSWWSQSMRLADMSKFAERGAYRMPESILNHADPRVPKLFRNTMNVVAACYEELVKLGVPMEDARELIPLGAQHRMSWKLNISSLQHVIGKRSCLVGSTKIPLADGRELTMDEIYSEFGTEKAFTVYSCDDNGNIVPGRARHNGLMRSDAELVEVLLDNGERLKCTPDHRFMLRNGDFEVASKLKPGDSLMPLYREISDGKSNFARNKIEGYEMVYVPALDGYEFTHRLFAPEKPDGCTTIHHANFNKRDNDPSNLKWMTNSDHMKLHSEMKLGKPILDQTREKLRAVPRMKRVKAGLAAAAKGVWKYACEKASTANVGNAERGAKISASLKQRLSDPDERRKRSELAKAQWQRPGMRDAMRHLGKNHKVVSVTPLAERANVYDLSVDEHHNFATSAGVFVHNCWILQLGIWGPIIQGMIKELGNKVDPIFHDLVTPPCIKGDDFKGCVYHEENRRRYTGDDKHAPCPLHVYHHHIPPMVHEGGGTLTIDGHACEVSDASVEEICRTPAYLSELGVPMAEALVARAAEYRSFWNRDPVTGKRLLPVVK